MNRAEEFEQLRPLLFSIAYRILGSVSEAEDAVQETWLRYEATSTEPTSAKAFLSAVVARISIDVLRSARVRREEYVGPWIPEPLLADPYEDPARSAELADSVSMAALLPLERLSPLEQQQGRELAQSGSASHVGSTGTGLSNDHRASQLHDHQDLCLPCRRGTTAPICAASKWSGS